MASSARASGSYLGSPENFAIRYCGGYSWYRLQALGEGAFRAAAARSPSHLGQEGERDDVAAVEVLAVGDHRHQRLARVAASRRAGCATADRRWAARSAPRAAARPAARKCGGVAARGAPELFLVVRAERAVVLDDEGVVQVLRGVRADGDAVHPGRVGQVGGRQPRLVAAPPAVGGAPVSSPPVVAAPRPGRGRAPGRRRPSPRAWCRPSKPPVQPVRSPVAGVGSSPVPNAAVYCGLFDGRWCPHRVAWRRRGRPRADVPPG